MKIAFNTMFKNEEKLLAEVLKIWQEYPIDLFIFYDDNSTDNSIEVIKRFLPEKKVIIINDNLPEFNESYQRQRMIDVAREKNVDIVMSIDCDELLTTNIIDNFHDFLSVYKTHNMNLFWYNSVNETIKQYRCDPLYANNFRSFVLPLKQTGSLNVNDYKYHTPRTPHVNLPTVYSKEFGIIHLQAINRRFYAIKQLWYKHHEFVKYGHSIEFINGRYDPVVNNLNFMEQEMPSNLIQGLEFNPEVFDRLEEEKGYLKFIRENYNPDLITFGKEYL